MAAGIRLRGSLMWAAGEELARKVPSASHEHISISARPSEVRHKIELKPRAHTARAANLIDFFSESTAESVPRTEFSVYGTFRVRATRCTYIRTYHSRACSRKPQAAAAAGVPRSSDLIPRIRRTTETDRIHHPPMPQLTHTVITLRSTGPDSPLQARTPPKAAAYGQTSGLLGTRRTLAPVMLYTTQSLVNLSHSTLTTWSTGAREGQRGDSTLS